MGKRLSADERAIVGMPARRFARCGPQKVKIAPVENGGAPPMEEPAAGGRFKSKLIGARG